MNQGENISEVKVCHITSVHARYDIRIFIKECKSLAQAGYNVSLVVADGMGDENKNNVAIYDVGKPIGRLKRMLFTPSKIYAKVLSLNPTVVHFHDPELMLIGLKLAKRGFRVIYDIHENLPKQILSKYWIKKPLRRMIAKVVDYLEQFVVRRITGVVTVVDTIAERFNSCNSNVIVVHNYPHLTELKPYMQNTNNDLNESSIIDSWRLRKDQLVYIGSISKIRGIEAAVNSLAISDLSLDLAGSFSEISLQDEIKNFKGFDKVIYHGVLSHLEAFQLLTTAKIGVLNLLPVPSYVESLPIKLFEYMAAGIPVIASNFKQWEEIILYHDCGIMVDPEDSAAIAVASLWLINNPSVAAIMGQNGVDAVIRYFNWEMESKKLVQFYQKILHHLCF